MPRKLSFGNSQVVIVSHSTLQSAEREVEANNPVVFVEYPDGATGTELAMIIKEAASVIRAVDELDDVEKKGNTI